MMLMHDDACCMMMRDSLSLRGVSNEQDYDANKITHRASLYLRK
jgi:hypothetical protein